jgi:Fe-S cluster biogenesis protein NfuA
VNAVAPGAPCVSLRVAATPAQRLAAIEAWLDAMPAPMQDGGAAVIAEGALLDRPAVRDAPLIGLAAGCPCCVGLTTLRVTIARTLRAHRPRALLLLLATEAHLPRLRRLLEDGELGVRFVVDSCP